MLTPSTKSCVAHPHSRWGLVPGTALIILGWKVVKQALKERHQIAEGATAEFIDRCSTGETVRQGIIRFNDILAILIHYDGPDTV